jgi:hypothetical protein
MARAAGPGVRVEAEQGDESGALFKAALFCVGVAVAFVAGGFYGLGKSGMLDPRSPDFAPVPHFFAFVALVLGAFFLVRAYMHGRRYRLFGTSVVEANRPRLGEALVGTLRIAKPDALQAPITLRLRCDWRHRSSSPGHPSQGATTTEHLWESSLELDPAGAAAGIPFRFAIPEDGLPSGRRPKPKTGVHPESPGDIVWSLLASSARRGMDYVAEFEVPVEPGQLSAERARQAGPKAAPHAPGDDSLAVRAAQVAGLALGGSVPTAEEREAEADAETRPEPETPFASSPRPEQDGQRVFRRVALIAAVALGVIALLALARQAAFGWGGTELRATVTTVEKHAVTLDLDRGDPAHTVYVSSFHRWERGQQVTALCEADPDGRRRCRMASGLDRWLDGLGTLAVALVALSVWLALRRPPAA